MGRPWHSWNPGIEIWPTYSSQDKVPTYFLTTEVTEGQPPFRKAHLTVLYRFSLELRETDHNERNKLV